MLPIKTLFLDIGGVLLTNNGWDHHARKRVVTYFKLTLAEMEDRHQLNFATYEEGKLTLKEIFRPAGLLPKAIVHPGSAF